jgi:SAM-dependent methyltransferase
MIAASAGTLLGDASGADLDDLSWSRLLLWRQELELLDRKLVPDLSNLPELLDRVPLAIWGQVLQDPSAVFSRADVYLPTMPSPDVQRAWTGLSGGPLLRQSVDFMAQVVLACAEAGIDPKVADVLDFGIGWGRLSRLWLKYAVPSRLVGCDAWESSIELGRDCQLPNELVLSDPLLGELPVAAASRDVVYAFSVFTSLGDVAFPRCLAGIRSMLKPGGVAVFTVRPPEYWSLRSDVPNALRDAESQDMFFRRYPDREQYGDTSVSLHYLDEVCAASGLGRPSLEWFPADPHQVVVRARATA